MRDRQEYRKVLKNRKALAEAGRVSVPDRPGATVALLMPFVPGLVQDLRDGFGAYERDAEDLTKDYQDRGYETDLRMLATVSDFADVLRNTSISTIVVRGFGTLSSIATPHYQGTDAPYGYLDWLHLAKMANHLKTGNFVMRVCGIATRRFNPPLPAGVVTSFRNIWAPAGKYLYVAGLDDPANELIRPITGEETLGYDQISEKFPLQRNWDVPAVVPDAVYDVARTIYNNNFNAHLASLPQPTRIPYPAYQSGLV
jgi:hypothetical protein